MLRIVVDTNVIVGSVISQKGAPAQLLDAWSEHLFDLVISEAILHEVERVLREPRLKETFNIAENRIARLVELLREDSILVPDTERQDGVQSNLSVVRVGLLTTSWHTSSGRTPSSQ